mgnify:CR=1 FL=1
MRMSRKARSLRVAACLMAVLLLGASCGDDEDEEAAESLRVGLIMGGPKNDGGFYEAGYNGILRAQADLGIDFTVVELVSPPEGEQAFYDLAEAGNTLIIGMGADFEDGGTAAAPGLPDVQLVVMNGRVTGPNLATYQLREGQSAFLATYLVSLLEPENTKFGLIGGIEIPPHLTLRDGMEVAMGLADRGGELLPAAFTGSFIDVALAKEAALAQIRNGATVLVPWSGSAVDGAFAAVEESADVKVIAALTDRCGQAPYFLASAVTDPGGLIYIVISEFLSDDWKPDTSKALGLETPEVGRVVPCGDVPDDIQARVDELKEGLINGTVEGLPPGL